MKPCIGLDVRMLRWSGIGRYIRGFTSELSSSTKYRYQLLSEGSVPPYGIREQLSVPFLSRACDCLHIPNFNAPLLWNKKLVVTFHDLILYHYPHHLKSALARTYVKTVQPLVAKKADAIIAVSEYTKQDLVKTFGINPDKIHVIYHGINSELLCAKAETTNHNSEKKEKPYFLYVGLIKEHKNVGVLLKAFFWLREKNPNISLRIVGKPDLKQRVVCEWFETIKNNPNVIHVDEVGDTELKKLYQNALALVFPSWLEGFGFPVLEAMALGTPIIAANASSIPEIVGQEAALLFDPHSASELHHRMERLLHNKNLRKQLVQKGKTRANAFNWHECVQKAEQVYDSVLGKK
jgi:glycosyltransferase involved in cell wall biosynthesis